MIFLKLGGSLITDKARPESVRTDTLSRLAEEIHAAWTVSPDLRLLIGHGSGSFGHYAASVFGTHRGAESSEDWAGFAEVWKSANRLNRLVVDALTGAGLPALSFPPSASALMQDGELVTLEVRPIERALMAGLVPVVQGDVVFDQDRGSAIASTEQVFAYLARTLRPERVLLAGIEPGVYDDLTTRARVLDTVSDSDLARPGLRAADAPDVTGGMEAKVRMALSLTREIPGVEVRIFSGDQPGLVREALLGKPAGTLIRPT